MSENVKLIRTEEKIKSLSDKEKYAYDRFIDKREAPLAADTQAKLFSLYLNGKTTDQIQRINPQFTLGQIVHAKVTGDWDNRLNEHIDALLATAAYRVRQVTLEAADFIADALSAAHKLHRDAIAKFLMTSNPDDLGDLKFGLHNYKDLWALYQNITGQDKEQSVKVTHSGKVETVSKSMPTFSAEDTADILEALVKKKREDKK